MPSIKKRGQHTYQITVSNGYNRDGKKITKFKTVTLDVDLTPRQQEKEIARIAAAFEDEVKNGRHIDSALTFEKYIERWLIGHCEKQLEIKTITSYKAELNLRILPAIGHVRLSKLSPLHLIEFYDSLKQDGCRIDGKPGAYSTRTIKYCHQIISSALQTAVHWQILGDNIAKK